MRLRRAAAAMACGAVALAVPGCSLEQDVASKSLSAGPDSSVAPAVERKLVDGAAFSLAAQRGHPVVLDFWASWCGPCVGEQPQLNRMATRYAGRVAVVGVDMQESAADVRGFRAAYDVPYGSIIDTDGSITAAYNVPSPPTTVVIDASGHVARSYYGAVAPDTLDNELDSLLAH